MARKLLFLLNPEAAHDLSLDMLGAAERLHLLKPFCPEVEGSPVQLMGLTFPNAVGLAAGLDKNADYFNALGQMGFGFVEVGTVTPRAQAGNPQPRLFRLVEEKAIINRMGFNNKGLEHLINNVKKRRYSGVLGVNIGKNKSTAEHEALNDYVACMEAVYPYADYIAVNISSPNTPGLRKLQFGAAFDDLLAGIQARRLSLSEQYGRQVPTAVKIAPDMSDDETRQVADKLMCYGMDAVIATNTTVGREGVEYSLHRDEAGGLSGAPLRDRSTHTIDVLARHLQGALPIIGVGGIFSGEDAREKIAAGASLIQLYSGFIFQGPQLIAECAKAID